MKTPMTPRKKRALLLLIGLLVIGVAVALILTAFRQNLVFFYTPTQVVAKEVPAGRAFRIGGMVVSGSLNRKSDSLEVSFTVTDTKNNVPVVYEGILPDLFKEGKGVVAQGALGTDGVFRATQVLAKHDENYMPPEAAHALEQAARTQQTVIEE